MPDTATDLRPITTQDLRAMRTSLDSFNNVTFHLRDGESFLRAHLRGDSTANRTGFDTFHQIPCLTVMKDYSRDFPIPDNLDLYAAFSSPYDTDIMRTLLSRMSAGDTLQLVWTRGNNNPNSDAIGWHRDELRIRILRARTKRVETYLVDVYVGPDNSARMVTRR